MSDFYICLISHAEYGKPRDAPGVSAEAVFSDWVPKLTALLDRLEKKTGRKVPITWCCGAYHDEESLAKDKVLCAQHFPDQWKALRDRGDEIGLHTHPPECGKDGFEGCWSQHKWIKEDVERMADFGFDAPRTYVPAMMLWQDELAATLTDLGFEASSTVTALPGKYLAWVELFDYLEIPIEQCLLSEHRPDAYPFRPYRMSQSGMALTGNTELIEMPVIGYLGKWDHQDFENSPPYDLLVKADQLRPVNSIAELYLSYQHDTGRPFPGLRQRWESRNEVKVDIWPTFFHPFEMNEERLKRTEKLLLELSEWEDVHFATALEAARAWKQVNPPERFEEKTEPSAPADADKPRR